jgi:hypothetical protein
MSSASDKKPDGKEPYEPPALTVYGTIRDITQGNVTTGRNDRVGGPQKTG